MGNAFANIVDRLQFAKISPTNICISPVTQFAVNGSTNVYHRNCQQSGKKGIDNDTGPVVQKSA